MYVAAVARVMEFMSSAGHFMVSRFHRDFDFLPNYVFDGGWFLKTNPKPEDAGRWPCFSQFTYNVTAKL